MLFKAFGATGTNVLRVHVVETSNACMHIRSRTCGMYIHGMHLLMLPDLKIWMKKHPCLVDLIL